MKLFFFGITATLAILIGLAYLGVTLGWMPANADARPPRIEEWAAKSSLHAALRRNAPRVANPVARRDANLIAGIKLYGANCAACHGVADGRASTIAVGLYQHAPQLGKHGVTDDPQGVTFWKIQHGIRFTGMPAYTRTLSVQQIWQVSLFLKNMNSLSGSAQSAWRALKNPVAIAPAAAQPKYRYRYREGGRR